MAPFFSNCSRKSLAALILMPNFVATADGVKTLIFMISATFFSFLASGAITPIIVRFSFGGPVFSFFLSLPFSSSSLTCCRSICFRPSFFFPPIFTCFLQLSVRELEGLAYFNLMLALPFFKRDAKLHFHFRSMDTVHRTERYYSSIWHRIVNYAALHTFQVKVVWVHEMHRRNH